MIDRDLTRAARPADLVRLGRPLDGGYAVPRSILSDCDGVVGLGVRDDWTFEVTASRGMKACRCLHLYDPTISLPWLGRRAVRSLPKLAAHAVTFDRDRLREDIHRLLAPLGYAFFPLRGIRHFSEWAGGEAGLKAAEVVNRAAQAGARTLLLKLDIEGAEYGFLDDIEAWAPSVALIVAEFHGLQDSPGRFNDCLRSLDGCYAPVHIHGNTGAGQLPCGFPRIPEITFVRRDLLAPGAVCVQHSYPIRGLDQANHRGGSPLAFDA